MPLGIQPSRRTFRSCVRQGESPPVFATPSRPRPGTVASPLIYSRGGGKSLESGFALSGLQRKSRLTVGQVVHLEQQLTEDFHQVTRCNAALRRRFQMVHDQLEGLLS